MRYLLIAIVISFISSSVLAADASMLFTYTSFYDKVETIRLGVSTNATDTVDQYDGIVPPFPPPGGERIIPVTFLPNGHFPDGELNEESVEVDIRFGETGIEFTKSYKVTVLGAYDRTPWKVTWGVAPDQLVSGVLRDDNYLGNGKFLFEVDILEENECIATSPISKWEYLLTWNLTPDSVEERDDIDDTPAPYRITENTLIYPVVANITVYDLKGTVAIQANGNRVQMNNLPQGIYIVVSEMNGKKYIDKYIR